MLDFIKRLSINLRATGPATVVIVWIIAVTVLGIFGGAHAKDAMILLSFAIGGILVALGFFESKQG